MINIPRLFMVLFLAGASASCRDNPDSKQIAQEQNEKTLDTRTAERDAQFVVNEISSGYAVIDWTTPVVRVNEHREMRDMAFRLQREHMRLMAKWKSYAEKKNILVPDSSVGPAKERVKNYTEQSNDSVRFRFWVDELLDQEKKILSRLEDYMDDAGDPALKILIQEELPVIRMHRDQLMMLKSKL
jgi:predicted outer membrane protein